MRLGGRRARGRNRSGGACNRTVRVAASQPEARDRGAFEARSRLTRAYALVLFCCDSRARVVAFVSLDRSSEIAPRVALGYPRVAPSPARRASRARAHLKLNRKHGNVPPDQHDRRRGDAEDQLSVLRRADVVHVLRVNVRLRASPRPRASSSSSVIPRRRVASLRARPRVLALARSSRARLSPRGPPHPSFALDRVPRARASSPHRFVRAAHRGSRRVHAASRARARGASSRDGARGEHDASVVVSRRVVTPPALARAPMSRGGARFFAYGVPFVALVAVGASGLARVVGGRLEVRDALGEVDDARAPARTQRRRRAMARFDAEAERRRLIDAREGREAYEMRAVWRPDEGGGHRARTRDARERVRRGGGADLS